MIELWRTDDHGNDFFMQSFDDGDEAERVRAQFEARGHHQTYWLRNIHGTSGPASLDLTDLE